jgi:carboxymethylenebutenolidase
MGKNIELAAADGHKFSAYRAEPAGKPKGGLIVVMEIFGVNSHIKKVADEYAADGYLAVAPAMFDRVQRGLDIGYTPQDIESGAASCRR